MNSIVVIAVKVTNLAGLAVVGVAAVVDMLVVMAEVTMDPVYLPTSLKMIAWVALTS